MSKFATALKEQAGLASHSVRTPESTTAEAARVGSRNGAKHIGGYFAPEVSKQLRALAVAEDTTVQDLLAEALNMLFQSRRLSMIAALSKEHATLWAHSQLSGYVSNRAKCEVAIRFNMFQRPAL